MTYAYGGTISYANGRRIHTFTDSGTLVVTEAGTVEALVVAGGGAGGGDYGNSGTAFGGGGGGGVIYTAALAVGLGNIAVTVGEGGISAQSAGGSITDAQNSVITDGNVNFTTQTAIRGGTSGQNGGSGGGGGGIGNTGGTGTVGQGNDGGDVTNFFTGAAGGGGAGVPGWPAPAVDFTDEAGAGGNGIASSISGETRYYGAGGGGGAWQYGNGGGGLGGGGNGAKIGTGARDGEFYGAGGGGQGASVGTGGRGHKGVVIFSYDSAFTTGRRVAENEDLADMAASTIKGRITTTGIPQDLTSTQVAGILASHFQPLDSDLTSIAGLSPTNDDIIQRKAGAWANRTLAQYKTDIHLENINVDTILTDTKDPTGWLDPTNVNVSYDSTARTITLTPVSGTLQYYWRGVKVDLGATWTSSAHDAADGGYYLYSSDGTNITWSTTVWTFDMLMVAKAIKSTTPAYAFAIKETHGLMPWEAHQELHDAISTYRTSGGTLTAGTYTENTATDAANTPGFDVAVIKDEDNSVTIPAWTQGTYTTLRIGASSKATFDTTATLPFRSSGSYILINNPTTGGETASTNNKYVNVYQVLIPATVDAGSQSYRMVMMQPQRDHPSLADAQLENPQNLSFGDLTSTTPEFVIYARITYALAAGDGNTGKARIATGGITYITGSRLAQTSSSGISNHEDLSGLLGGATDEHYHLTSAEYTGTGSGVFTRTTSPTLVAPVISNFFYANHTHAASGVTGGTLASATGLPLTTGVTGILPAANGGTGINNSTRTLTISTNAGTIDFSAAASTLTVPATGQALVATVGATTVGRIPYYSTVTGSVTSTANFAFDGSKLAIGTATPDASYRATLEGAGLLVNFSTNALFDAFTLRNLNTGTSAGVRAGITTDAGTLYFEAFSDAYTTTNWQGKSGLLATSGLNGIFIASPTTIQFDSSNTAVSAFVFDVTKGKALFTAFSTTGADTVLELDQSDASEEYINFISDAVTANYPVDTATAVGTAYARLRVAVNGTFKYIQLYNA